MTLQNMIKQVPAITEIIKISEKAIFLAEKMTKYESLHDST
jgi:hypothetical protein